MKKSYVTIEVKLRVEHETPKDKTEAVDGYIWMLRGLGYSTDKKFKIRVASIKRKPTPKGKMK